MAKKKTEDNEDISLANFTGTRSDDELTQEELEAQFDSEAPKEKPKKKIVVKEKKQFSLADFKKNIKHEEVPKKPVSWIPMSPAFQETTHLPGIPEGHVSMVFGRSDVGKTTMLVELAVSAQQNGIVPVLVITENKFSKERAATMGLDLDNCILKDGIIFIEEGLDFMNEILDCQESGELPKDIVFLWDSIGSTPSRAEYLANKEGKGRAMMETAKLLREKIHRYIWHRITATQKEDFPYNATAFFVCGAYPQSAPGQSQPSLVHSGGDGIYLAATLAFRMGGVMSRSSKVTAVKEGVEVGFAIKSALIVDKNHITNVTSKGKIVCTDHGFILDDKSAIDAYKKQYKDDWDLNFDKFWDSVTTEE
jgi:hypothetical protein